MEILGTDGTLWEEPVISLTDLQGLSGIEPETESLGFLLTQKYAITRFLLYPLSEHFSIRGGTSAYQWEKIAPPNIDFPNAESYAWFAAKEKIPTRLRTHGMEEPEYEETLFEIWAFDREHKFPVALGYRFGLENIEVPSLRWSGAIEYDANTWLPRQFTLEGSSQWTIKSVRPRDVQAPPITIDLALAKRRINLEDIPGAQADIRIMPFRRSRPAAAMLLGIVGSLILLGTLRPRIMPQEATIPDDARIGQSRKGTFLTLAAGLMLCVEWVNLTYLMYSSLGGIAAEFMEFIYKSTGSDLLSDIDFILILFWISACTMIAPPLGFIRRRKLAVWAIVIILVGFVAILIMDTIIPYYLNTPYLRIAPIRTVLIFFPYIFALILARRYWAEFK